MSASDESKIQASDTGDQKNGPEQQGTDERGLKRSRSDSGPSNPVFGGGSRGRGMARGDFRGGRGGRGFQGSSSGGRGFYEPPRKKDRKEYLYGNYDGYYGFRLGGASAEDPRIRLLEKAWFEGKRCLDIGCNSGILTINLASQFHCRHIMGVDIDADLVLKARKNAQIISSMHRQQAKREFAPSMAACQGPLPDDPEPTAESILEFPENCSFRRENWVMDDPFPDAEYDTILCLSVTKWVHFNWGDDGVMKLFHKVFRALAKGGRFILEAQDWKSYKKKNTLVPLFKANVAKIQLRPSFFKDYLLRNVGFTSFTRLQPPENPTKGFDRPLLVFVK